MTITEKGYAKINLSLDVTGRYPNGYHEVCMVMQSVNIHDDITITLTPPDTESSDVKYPVYYVKMNCNIPNLSCGDSNLIIKAAKAIINSVGLNVVTEESNPEQLSMDELPMIEISLYKRIPMAAGMAGGSTDAAAVLRGLNKLLNLGLSIDRLCEIGGKFGADIPYCVKGGSMLAQGIGEKLTPLSQMPKTYLTVIKPEFDVSTKYVYEHIDTVGVERHPDTQAMIEAIDTKDLPRIASLLANVLEDVTIGDYPIIAEIKDFLLSKGALGALMSGSGSSIFGIFDSYEASEAASLAAQKQYPDIEVFTTTII